MQQHLPFTVLKLFYDAFHCLTVSQLQQHLPFTVLKPDEVDKYRAAVMTEVATALTVYGIETNNGRIQLDASRRRCNSTYRLRY